MSSFIIAFAMYSKIPMPKVMWNEKNMKYAICYFPLIGVVIAGVELICYRCCELLQMGSLLRGVLLSIIPLILTGGIHMDGYLDTVDARNSYGEKEKKLDILKDPHTGAFAIIKGMLYLAVQIGFFSEVSWYGLQVFCIAFVVSRAMSGFALAQFKGARENGLLASFAKGADTKVVKKVMTAYYLLAFAVMTGMIAGMNRNESYLIALTGMLFCSIVVFAYYRYFSYREFGGITGDLAGYFLQIVELLLLITVVIVEKVCLWFS